MSIKRSASKGNNDLKMLRPGTGTDNMDNSCVLPSNKFHLGGDHYVVSSTFGDRVNVHIRKYVLDKNQQLIPTKEGVCLHPFVWQNLANKMEYTNYFSEREVIVIQDSLMLSNVQVNNVPHLSLQCYLKRQNFSRYFLPNICLLTKNEWEMLESLRERVTSSAMCLLLQQIFPRFVEREVSKQSSTPSSDFEKSDVDMVLTTSLLELLKIHLQKQISELFECSGCRDGCENQLGHDCINLSYAHRLRRYGNLALFSINFEQLAADFVNQNIHIVNYINENFFNSLIIPALLESVKEMYVASEPDLFASCE